MNVLGYLLVSFEGNLNNMPVQALVPVLFFLLMLE